MLKIKSFFSGSYIIKPDFYTDKRGIFYETFHQKKYSKMLKNYKFIQDNFSKSKKNVLRGMHFQSKNSQGKLVFVIKGKIFDVIVDLRKNSRTFGKWKSIILSEQNKLQLWVPPGFAHGFLALSKDVNLIYKCTSLYNPKHDQTLIWNDKEININWPIKRPILSEKDKNGETLKCIISKLKLDV